MKRRDLFGFLTFGAVGSAKETSSSDESSDDFETSDDLSLVEVLNGVVELAFVMGARVGLVSPAAAVRRQSIRLVR